MGAPVPVPALSLHGCPSEALVVENADAFQKASEELAEKEEVPAKSAKYGEVWTTCSYNDFSYSVLL